MFLLKLIPLNKLLTSRSILSGFRFKDSKTSIKLIISLSIFLVKLIIFNLFVLGAINGITGKSVYEKVSFFLCFGFAFKLRWKYKHAQML